MIWVKVWCPECKNFIAEAKEGTELYCVKCHKWITVKKGVGKNDKRTKV